MPNIQVNGSAAYVHDGGVPWQPGRPAVAFIHGAGFDHTLWQQQSRALAHGSSQLPGFNVAALDLPGHGHSADVPGIASVGDLADWVGAALDAAGLVPAALVGHSLGSCIAVELAARRPEAVTAVVMVNAGLPMKVSAELLHDTAEDQPRAVNFITAFAHAKPTQLGMAPTPGNWIMGSAAALIFTTTPEVLHRDFAVCDAWDGASVAARVRCPALLAAGAGDRMTPLRNGKALADAVPGARLEVLPGAGHMIPTEAPRALLKLLRGFLSQAG